MSNNQNNIDKIPPKTHGKKLLITLKNAQNIYNNYSGSSIEDDYKFMEQNDDFIKEYKEIIENEEEEINMNKKNENNVEEISQEMLSDVDLMLKEIQELKSNINDFKLKNKIKTKRDYLKYMNLIDKNIDDINNSNKKDMCKSQKIFYKNKLEKSFNEYNEEEKYSEYKKYLIPKESQKEKDYINIKDKLQKQEELLKLFEQTKNEIENIKSNNIDNDNNLNNLNEADIFIHKCTGDADVDKLLNEIKLADEKMYSYLKDIDECLEMNENIEKQLDNDDGDDELINNNKADNSNTQNF